MRRKKDEGALLTSLVGELDVGTLIGSLDCAEENDALDEETADRQRRVLLQISLEMSDRGDRVTCPRCGVVNVVARPCSGGVRCLQCDEGLDVEEVA